MSANAYINLTIDELVKFAIQRNEGELASNQALVVKTGARTGRSPKDRFIVRDAITENTVAWNNINQAVATETFNQLWLKASSYLTEKDSYFISYLKVGADAKHAVAVKVMTELAWHNLFAHVLFIHPPVSDADSQQQWTILNVPGFKT